ncbi:MAG TPA: hypothetical protein DDY98_02190 [Ruminococcaceae bacterium]|nr:hypothetical protein [Oscillospiraceae bacterium]
MAQKFCTNCGAPVLGNGSFCTECGLPLNAAESSTPFISTPLNDTAAPVGFGQPSVPMQMGKLAPVDMTLTMLAEYCTKTVATVGGDGYTEWVLNQCSDGSLQVDYYRNYVGYEEEIHSTFPAAQDTWEKIIAIKERYNLKTPSAERNFGMCGGYEIVKIRDGDVAIRLTTGMLTQEERQAFLQIKALLIGIASD